MTGVSSALRAGSQTREQSNAVVSVTQLCEACYKQRGSIVLVGFSSSCLVMQWCVACLSCGKRWPRDEVCTVGLSNQ